MMKLIIFQYCQFPIKTLYLAKLIDLPRVSKNLNREEDHQLLHQGNFCSPQIEDKVKYVKCNNNINNNGDKEDQHRKPAKDQNKRKNRDKN